MWKLFDIRFSYKYCYFSRGCPLVKMASKTVIRPKTRHSRSIRWYSRTVFCSYSKAVWLIRFSLNEIPSPGCDTLLALSTKYIMVFCPKHTKRYEKLKVTHLSKTTRMPAPFIWESPPPPRARNIGKGQRFSTHSGDRHPQPGGKKRGL